MLSNPKSGWTEFKLGKKNVSLSYLTDISINWLDAAIEGLKDLRPFSVSGFLEPSRLICTVSFWNTHVFFEDDDNIELKVEDSDYEIVHISMLEFCENLYADINNNLQNWVEWFCDEEIDLDKRKNELTGKLDELKQLIEKQKNWFSDNCTFF